MKDLLDLHNFVQRHATDELVLCTLVRKKGSSYRGVGAKKIVRRTGGACGILSGGCLEAAIENLARDRFDELPFLHTFDMSSAEDRLLGYQTGCQGAIDILFERLRPESLPLQIPFGHNPPAECVRVDLSKARLAQREFSDYVSHSAVATSVDALLENWVEPLQLFIVGCGADTHAFIPLAEAQGWQIQFIDYRRDLVADFPQCAVYQPIPDIPASIPQGRRVAVVITTHNFEADLEIARGLVHHRLGYIGWLGPAKRYQQLKTDLMNLYGIAWPEHLDQVSFAPAGIFMRSRSPEAIALSIVAQIQRELVEFDTERVWTLILAAGASSRYGSPKALAKISEQTFLARALETGHAFSAHRVMVVTGAHHEDIEPHLAGTEVCFNENWSAGMGTSIALGVSRILQHDPAVERIAILPVDQPFVSAAHLHRLDRAALQSSRCALTTSARVSGPPAVIPRGYFADACSLKEDRGLRSVLSPAQIVGVEDAEALLDIDSK